MEKKDIIIAGLEAQFGIGVVPPEVYHVEFKGLSEMTELMKDDDSYSYCDGGSHDTYALVALYEDGKEKLFKNASRQRYGANHMPDTVEEGEDWDEFLMANLSAGCFLIHHSYSASWEDENQNVEDLFVIIPNEREKRKFLFTIKKKYQEFVDGINRDLFGHAGEDEYISVLVPVSRKDEVIRFIESSGEEVIS